MPAPLARSARVVVLSAFALTLAACSTAAPTAQPTAAPAAPTAAPKPTTAAAANAPAAAGAATSGAVSCSEFASQGAGGAPIKIGSDGSLTGATANFGTGMKRGIEICAKEFNDAGGYQGRKVNIAILDDQVKPELAVANVTRFLQQDKVVAVIGPVNSGNALAYLPKIEEAEVPDIVPVSTSV